MWRHHHDARLHHGGGRHKYLWSAGLLEHDRSSWPVVGVGQHGRAGDHHRQHAATVPGNHLGSHQLVGGDREHP